MYNIIFHNGKIENNIKVSEHTLKIAKVRTFAVPNFFSCKDFSLSCDTIDRECCQLVFTKYPACMPAPVGFHMRVIMTRTCTFTSVHTRVYSLVDVSELSLFPSIYLSFSVRALAFDEHALPHVFADITQINLASMPRTCSARNIRALDEAIVRCTVHLPASYCQHVPLAPFSTSTVLYAFVSPPVVSSLLSSFLGYRLRWTLVYRRDESTLLNCSSTISSSGNFRTFTSVNLNIYKFS